MKDKSVLVVFGDELPSMWARVEGGATVVVASPKLRSAVESAGSYWINIDELIGPGSIYEAAVLLEDLSYLTFDTKRIAKSFLYKGYELWWIHCNDLYLYFCLPFTQYKTLLEYLKNFQHVHVYRPPYKSLFSCYLQAYGVAMTILPEPGLRSPSFLPFGVLLQILITFLSLPVLIVQRRRLMLYVGDKLEKGRDYDFRMKSVYEELRRRQIPFIEFVRGVEPWRTVLWHAWTRRRPAVYSETAVFIGRFMSVISGGRSRARQKFGSHHFISETNPEARFKLLVATQYLLGVYDDVWAIRIMKFVLRAIGVRVAFVPVASERSFHAVLGCKLNNVPTIGILHGVASKNYNIYDFMPGFDGQKTLSVDIYGLWSEWWRSYYAEYSNAYTSEQLKISGAMRPVMRTSTRTRAEGRIKVLLVSEQQAVPSEVLPYLEALLENKNVSVFLTFRPYQDGFEEWLKKHRPDIFERVGEAHIIRTGIHDAIAHSDVVVGCQSTGVIEAVLQLKTPIYFQTKKWGDYYNLKDYGLGSMFFAENSLDLMEKIHQARIVPLEALKNLQERFFGDPYKNGSKWVVEQVEQLLR